jgi:hypothetical protein
MKNSKQRRVPINIYITTTLTNIGFNELLRPNVIKLTNNTGTVSAAIHISVWSVAPNALAKTTDSIERKND